MKQLSSDVVDIVTNFLVLTFGKTTTLDVKENLRKLGFDAKQRQVSEIMAANAIFSELEVDGKVVELVSSITTEAGRAFKVYSFAEIDDSDIDDDDEDQTPAIAAVTAPGQPLDPKTYIRRNLTSSSAILAGALGISEASVRAYKANITRGN